MNRREKKLMAVTAIIVVVGGISFLVGDESPAKNKPTANASTTPPPPKPTTTTTATPPPVAPISTSGGHYAFDGDSLRTLLERPQRGVAEDVTDIDPFRAIAAVEIAGTTTTQKARSRAVPRIDGVYLSGTTRGALIDGDVKFIGEMVGEYRLVDVTAHEVRLFTGEEELVLPFNPHLATPGKSPKELQP